MAIGLVLISAAPAHKHEVHDMLSNIPEIVELHALFREYDVIAKIEAEDYEKLGKILVNKIRVIGGIIDMKTLT